MNALSIVEKIRTARSAGVSPLEVSALIQTARKLADESLAADPESSVLLSQAIIDFHEGKVGVANLIETIESFDLIAYVSFQNRRYLESAQAYSALDEIWKVMFGDESTSRPPIEFLHASGQFFGLLNMVNFGTACRAFVESSGSKFWGSVLQRIIDPAYYPFTDVIRNLFPTDFPKDDPLRLKGFHRLYSFARLVDWNRVQNSSIHPQDIWSEDQRDFIAGGYTHALNGAIAKECGDDVTFAGPRARKIWERTSRKNGWGELTVKARVESLLGSGGTGAVFGVTPLEGPWPQKLVAIKVIRENVESFDKVKLLQELDRGYTYLQSHTGPGSGLPTVFGVCFIPEPIPGTNTTLIFDHRLRTPVERLLGLGAFKGFHLGIIMEYVQGNTLAELPKLREFSLDEVQSIVKGFLPICNALSFIHDRGWLHQDIKPENVITPVDSIWRLVDFGSARLESLPTNESFPGTNAVSPARVHLCRRGGRKRK